MFIFLCICSLLVPLSMIILGYTWKNKPPKDRQGMSGYRSTVSRMNDETWKYAHRCWGWINCGVGIILVILRKKSACPRQKSINFIKVL